MLKRTVRGALLCALALGAAVGCDGHDSGITTSPTADSASTPTATDFFSLHRGTLVGDNSAVGTIINHLEWENTIDGFALSTSEQPYGITINQGEVAQSDGSYRIMSPDIPTNIRNGAYILALVENADWFEFKIPVHPCPAPPTVCLYEYRVTRSDIEEQLGKPLAGFTTETDLNQAIAGLAADQ
jgi:hypothetical protein